MGKEKKVNKNRKEKQKKQKEEKLIKTFRIIDLAFSNSVETTEKEEMSKAGEGLTSSLSRRSILILEMSAGEFMPRSCL